MVGLVMWRYGEIDWHRGLLLALDVCQYGPFMTASQMTLGCCNICMS